VYAGFLDRWSRRANTEGDCGFEPDNSLRSDCGCATASDSAGTRLFQHDHDVNASTPEKCYGFNYSDYMVPTYGYFAYDAVYALAHAAQIVIDEGGSEFTGAAIREALKKVSFQGVTGTVEFMDNGDREIGVGSAILNHDGGEFVPLGSWTREAGFFYGEGRTRDGIVWPTSTGEQPSGVVIIGEGSAQGVAMKSGLDSTTALIGVGFLLVVTTTLTVIVQKFSNKKIEFEEEKALTPDEELQKVCDTLIQGQQAWLAFELVDAFSDIVNGVMAVQEGTITPTFLALFVIIALFSVFAGINAVVKRNQVINGVRKIRDCDEETMNRFKDGATGGIVTVHNPALQWELTTAELLVSELAATNGLLEDLPSFLLNVVSVVIAFRRPGFKASPQFYVGFGALLVSCITGGRKTYLRDKLKALRAKKGEIEADMKKRSGGRLSIVGGSLKMIRQLDVEGGELRGAEGIKGARIVPAIGGEEIKALEGESDGHKIARLEREKKEALAREKEGLAREKAANEELAELKKKN